jgi:adenine-specific DNA-methyltransferase
MPILNWVGKDKVVNYHHNVPFRLLEKITDLKQKKEALKIHQAIG